MSDGILDGIVGWSMGYTFSIEKKKEDEIAQGANHYIASVIQVGMLAHLGVAVSKLNDALPQHALKTPIKIICNLGPILALPVLVYCASVKQGHHEVLAKWFNATDYAYIKLPETLNGSTVKVLSFVADHCGNIARVAMLATGVALIALGNVYYGAAILTAIGYEAMDTFGLIPRRISLFMEIYMPTVALIGGLIGGTVLVRLYSAVALPSYAVPQVAQYIHRKVDSYIRSYFKMQGATLEQIDAPLVEKKEMTFDEINDLLEKPSSWNFEINPSHCSHPVLDIDKLPKDEDFDKFQQLFDAIDWESKYHSLVKKKLADDDRFMELLLKEFPGKTKDALRSDFETYMEDVASKKGVTKERFAADWMREQMLVLIDLLQGRRRVKGQQQDLDEAIQDSAILLPHISAMQNPIDQEDALAKLAVEGGDYCGRGIKRAANELVRGLIQVGDQDPAVDDPIRAYEMQVLQVLQNKRHDIVLQGYQALANQLGIPNAVSQDTHGFDIYRFYLSLGFYPLTKHERNRVGVVEICVWELYNNFIQSAYANYFFNINDVVDTIGRIYFADYIRRIINGNDQLTDAQKDELIEKFTDCNNDQWTIDETHERFSRLMFVRLGVLVPKP